MAIGRQSAVRRLRKNGARGVQMPKRKMISFPTSHGFVSFHARKTKTDNSLMKKSCPLFRSKCKGPRCVFGDYKRSMGSFLGEKNELYCKLFSGLTGKIKIDLETQIKREDD
jgi:hypothetical protein